MNREQLAEHLRFAAELGVRGVSRDPAWRTRGAGPNFPDGGAGPNFSAGGVGRGLSEDEPAHNQLVSGTTDEAASPSGEFGPTPTASGKFGPTPIFRSAAEALEAVRADIGPDCSRCKLHTLGRTQVVFGVGNPDADLMFVGEAPGADEDEQGIPFVGRAGQLLTKIIEAIGLTRNDVYIANVIKCRPPGNRNPEPDEVETCEPFLFQQIDIIRPKVIVALGKFAAQALLTTDAPISRLRGRVYEYRGAKLIPTFHPAYLLRNPSSKREVWEDMKVVRSLLQSPRP